MLWESIDHVRGIRMLWGGEDVLFNRVIRVGLTEKVMCEQRPKDKGVTVSRVLSRARKIYKQREWQMQRLWSRIVSSLVQELQGGHFAWSNWPREDILVDVVIETVGGWGSGMLKWASWDVTIGSSNVDVIDELDKKRVCKSLFRVGLGEKVKRGNRDDVFKEFCSKKQRNGGRNTARRASFLFPLSSFPLPLPPWLGEIAAWCTLVGITQ